MKIDSLRIIERHGILDQKKFFLLADFLSGYRYLGEVEVKDFRSGEKISCRPDCPKLPHSHILADIEYVRYFDNLGLLF